MLLLCYLILPELWGGQRDGGSNPFAPTIESIIRQRKDNKMMNDVAHRDYYIDEINDF